MCAHETLSQEKEEAKTRTTLKPTSTHSKMFLLNTILGAASYTTQSLRKYFALDSLPGETLKSFQIITTSGGNQAARLSPTVDGQSRAQLERLVLTQPKAAARNQQCEPGTCFQLTPLKGFSSPAPLIFETTKR